MKESYKEFSAEKYEQSKRKARKNLSSYLKKFNSIITQTLSSDIQSINILCPGCGDLPTGITLVSELKSRFPQLRTINFYLIDINKQGVNQAKQVIIEKTKAIRVNINFITYSQDVLEVLKKQSLPQMDIVYFERPPVCMMGTFVGQTLLPGLFGCGQTHFRQAFAYLGKVLKPSSLIIVFHGGLWFERQTVHSLVQGSPHLTILDSKVQDSSEILKISTKFSAQGGFRAMEKHEKNIARHDVLFSLSFILTLAIMFKPIKTSQDHLLFLIGLATSVSQIFLLHPRDTVSPHCSNGMLANSGLMVLQAALLFHNLFASADAKVTPRL